MARRSPDAELLHAGAKRVRVKAKSLRGVTLPANLPSTRTTERLDDVERGHIRRVRR